MGGRTVQTGQNTSGHYRDRFYSQVKEEEARKLGLHVSLDEELLNIGKPSSSSNCKLSMTLFNLATEIGNILYFMKTTICNAKLLRNSIN